MPEDQIDDQADEQMPDGFEVLRWRWDMTRLIVTDDEGCVMLDGYLTNGEAAALGRKLLEISGRG